MEYRTIYEIGVSPMNFLIWLLPTLSVIGLIAAVCACVYTFVKKSGSWSIWLRRIGCVVLFVFIFIFNFSGYSNYKENLRRFEEGRYEVLEGNVTRFSESSFFNKEYFEVNGKRFAYSQNETVNGAQYRSLKGEIEKGSYVKVYYTIGTANILKLEVRE